MSLPVEPILRFVPSVVDGLPSVTEIAIFPDRMELKSNGAWVVVRFVEIARWRYCGWLYRQLARWGFGIRGRPTVADRYWAGPSTARYFKFYSTPPISVFMPAEPSETEYDMTLFRRIHNAITSGGFDTFDLA